MQLYHYLLQFLKSNFKITNFKFNFPRLKREESNSISIHIFNYFISLSIYIQFQIISPSIHSNSILYTKEKLKIKKGRREKKDPHSPLSIHLKILFSPLDLIISADSDTTSTATRHFIYFGRSKKLGKLKKIYPPSGVTRLRGNNIPRKERIRYKVTVQAPSFAYTENFARKRNNWIVVGIHETRHLAAPKETNLWSILFPFRSPPSNSNIHLSILSTHSSLSSSSSLFSLSWQRLEKVDREMSFVRWKMVQWWFH